MGTKSFKCVYCRVDDAEDDPFKKVCTKCGWEASEKGSAWCTMCGGRLNPMFNIDIIEKEPTDPDRYIGFDEHEGYTTSSPIDASPVIGEDENNVSYSSRSASLSNVMYSPSTSSVVTPGNIDPEPVTLPNIKFTDSPVRHLSIPQYRTKDPSLALSEKSIEFHSADSVKEREDEIKRFINERIEAGDLVMEKNELLTVYRWDGKTANPPPNPVKKEDLPAPSNAFSGTQLAVDLQPSPASSPNLSTHWISDEMGQMSPKRIKNDDKFNKKSTIIEDSDLFTGGGSLRGASEERIILETRPSQHGGEDVVAAHLEN